MVLPPDAPPAPDARPPDAAPTPPDATPPIDATPGPDADTTPDATPCVSDDECDAAGSTCNEGGQQITCEEVQTGCFQVSDDEPVECGANQACVADEGCVCNANENCEAAGEFCTDDGLLTCTADEDGCLINEPAVPCAAPQVCDPDEGGEGHAECVCPAVGTEPGTGCTGTPAGTITCSGDIGQVMQCGTVGACPLVWALVDDCAADGLECSQNDCVCPDNTEGDRFWANSVVDRSARPPAEIIPTGVREPAICAFEEMSTAIAFAIEFSGPNNLFDTFAIASNDDGDGDGANDPVARFEKEAWPWPRIPDNVTVTTEHDATVGINGTGNLDPTQFIMVVNSHDRALIADAAQEDDASVHISGRTNRLTASRGGAVKGMTFVREACRFTEDADEGCEPVAIAIYLDGVSDTVTGTALNTNNTRIDRVTIEGAGEGEVDLARIGDEADCLDGDGEPTDPVSGIFTGGEIAATPASIASDYETSTFLFVAPVDTSDLECFDEDGIFDDVDAGDWFRIDSGPAAGTYFIEDILEFADVLVGGEEHDGVLVLRGSAAPADITSTWTVLTNETSGGGPVFGGDGSWRFGFMGDGDGIINRLTVNGFASANFVENGRVGALTVGNFGEQFGDHEDDHLVYAGLIGDFNDVTYLHENGRALITESLFPPDTRSSITNSHGFGVLVEEGILDAEHLTVTGTTPGVGSDVFDDSDGDVGFETGDGIRIVNWGNSVTSWSDVVSTANFRHGAYVGNNEGDNRDNVYCFNDDGWDGDEVACASNDKGALPGDVVTTEAGFVDFSGAQLSGNETDGLHITDYGVVVQNGGDISDNGRHGIGMNGYSTFNAGSAEGGDGESDPLHVENNGWAGLFATVGEANLTDTVFTNNGTSNLCEAILGGDLEDEDMRAPAIVIGEDAVGDDATLHAINIEVTDNNGAGIVINTPGDDNYEVDEAPIWTPFDELDPPSKLPAADEASARPNTLEDSLIDGNKGIFEDGGCIAERWPTAGVEVWDGGVVNAVNSTGNSTRENTLHITNNLKEGLWVSGQFIRPGANRVVTNGGAGTGDDVKENPAPVVISGNGWTGATVASRDGAVLELVDGSITNNGHGEDAETDDGLAVHGGTTSVEGTTIDDNAEVGVFVDTPPDDNNADPFYTPSATRVTLSSLTVNGNGGDGIHLLGAPGALGVVTNSDRVGEAYPGTLMDVDPRTVDGHDISSADYGVQILNPDFVITDNGGDGLHVGGPAQDMNVTVWIDRGEIFLNQGAGVRLEQHASYAPDTSECVDDQGIDGDLDDNGSAGPANVGEKTAEFGCSGVTQHGLKIHDNIEQGQVVSGVYFVPRTFDEVNYRLGFSSNEIYHNAIEPGCGTTTSGGDDLPQVDVFESVPQDPDLCGQFGSLEACEDSSDGDPSTETNYHCFWFETQCLPIYDMRGAFACGQTTANPNQIHSYNTSDASEFSVGLYASESARVWVDNNSFRTNEFSKNVDQASGGNVILDLYCGGIFTTCVSP